MSAYSQAELDAYERGRKAGYVAGRIDGVSEAIAAMTQAGRAVAKAAKAPRKPLRIIDYLNALMEST